jgi:hypothetical protein
MAIASASAIRNKIPASLTCALRPTTLDAMGAIGTASEIDHVTVYSRGARVRRISSIGIGVEAGEVRIWGLPLGLVDDTVRAEVIGGGAVTGVRVELDAATAAARADDAHDREVRAARARLAAVETELARLSTALAGVAALAPAARKPRPDGAEVPAWSRALDARLAVLELRIGREAALREAQAAAKRDAIDAREALAAAEDRAARASTGRGLRARELCKVVVAAVDALAPGARLAIEYLVGAARWAPTYTARLTGGAAGGSGGAVAGLELRAVVAQSSGEDWRGARLTLSTAEPMRFAELPELPMARIGRRQPPAAKRGFRAAPTGVDALYQDFDRAFPDRPRRETVDRYGADDVTQEHAPVPPPPPREFDTDEGAALHTRLSDADFAAMPARGEVTRARPSSYAPPLPGAAMPPAPPPMQAMPPAKSRGGGVLSNVGAIAAAPFGAVAAIGGMAGKAMMKKEQRAGDDADFDDEADAAAGGGAAFSLAADDAVALLAYAEVRMMPATDRRRGTLVRVGAHARYAEALAARGLALAADAEVGAAIAARAAAIDALVLPPGTRVRWDHHYDHAFACDAPVDLPSDATWHAIAVTATSAPVAIRHVVVPREGAEVYRVAELTNPLAAPLLPGPIDVFDDGVYLLTSDLDGVPAGGRLELGLGVDPKVKAARNTDYREEQSGMLRGSLKLEHEIEVEVTNHASRAIDLEIRERIPVVRDGDDDIELTVLRTEPRWEAWSPEPDGPGAPRLTGGHRWRFAIPPGETRKAVAAYAIRIAAKHELVGGNRRES